MKISIIITVILLIVLGVLYWFAYRTMTKKKQAWDVQYNAYKETRDVFVLNKKISKQPVNTKYMKFLKVKVYQIVGRVTVSQSMKGLSHSATQTITFNTDKKEFAKVQPNHKYKMELAGNYIGKVFAPAPDSKGKKTKNVKELKPKQEKQGKQGKQEKQDKQPRENVKKK